MFSEKTRPINAADFGTRRRTDRRARREGRRQHVLFQLWRPFTSPIVRETRTPRREHQGRKAARAGSRVQKFRSICESSVSQSRHEIASNGENDLKVDDGRNPQRKAERGGAFGVRVRARPCFIFKRITNYHWKLPLAAPFFLSLVSALSLQTRVGTRFPTCSKTKQGLA